MDNKVQVGKYYKHIHDGDIVQLLDAQIGYAYDIDDQEYEVVKVTFEVVSDPRNSWGQTRGENRCSDWDEDEFTGAYKPYPAYDTPLGKVIYGS